MAQSSIRAHWQRATDHPNMDDWIIPGKKYDRGVNVVMDFNTSWHFFRSIVFKRGKYYATGNNVNFLSYLRYEIQRDLQTKHWFEMSHSYEYFALVPPAKFEEYRTFLLGIINKAHNDSRAFQKHSMDHSVLKAMRSYRSDCVPSFETFSNSTK